MTQIIRMPSSIASASLTFDASLTVQDNSYPQEKFTAPNHTDFGCHHAHTQSIRIRIRKFQHPQVNLEVSD